MSFQNKLVYISSIVMILLGLALVATGAIYLLSLYGDAQLISDNILKFNKESVACYLIVLGSLKISTALWGINGIRKGNNISIGIYIFSLTVWFIFYGVLGSIFLTNLLKLDCYSLCYLGFNSYIDKDQKLAAIIVSAVFLLFAIIFLLNIVVGCRSWNQSISEETEYQSVSNGKTKNRDLEMSKI